MTSSPQRRRTNSSQPNFPYVKYALKNPFHYINYESCPQFPYHVLMTPHPKSPNTKYKILHTPYLKSFILLFLLISASIFAFNSQTKRQLIQTSLVSPNPTPRLSFTLNSPPTLSKDSSTNLLIVDVTIQADSSCSETQSACAFHRNNFQLTDSNNQTYPPAGPPLFFIPNFQSRELVSSRTLNKNQSETGQLYFLVPQQETRFSIIYTSSTGASELQYIKIN